MKYRALHRKVLAVAVLGEVGDWAAYVGPVPGKNHDQEYLLVQEEGTKLSQNVAEAIFPEYKHLCWRI